MINRMYTIYDSAAEVYMRPFMLQADGQAIRAFTDLVNNPQEPIGQHPEDYTLLFCGLFDDQAGRFIDDGADVLPQSLGNGLAFKRGEKALEGPAQLTGVN